MRTLSPNNQLNETGALRSLRRSAKLIAASHMDNFPALCFGLASIMLETSRQPKELKIKDLFERALENSLPEILLRYKRLSEGRSWAAELWLSSELKDLQTILVECFPERRVFDLLGSEILGYFYQFAYGFARAQALKAVQSADKTLSAEAICRFTQIYTPGWVVDFLVENCLSAQYISVTNPRLIDPACGAGHFLLGAYRSMAGRRSDDRTASMQKALAESLYGLDIDPLGLAVAALSLSIETQDLLPELLPPLNLFDARLLCLDGHSVPEAVHESELVLGSLCGELPLRTPFDAGFDVVLSNPPYLGRRLIDRQLKAYLKRNFAGAHHDLSSAFLRQSISLLKEGGMLGMITQGSFLYLPSYQDLRKEILALSELKKIVELGNGVFPFAGGEKISSALIVLKGGATGGFCDYLDIRQETDKPEALAAGSFLQIHTDRFHNLSDTAFDFRSPGFLLPLRDFKQKLVEAVDIRQGIATTDNARFLQFWWSVEESELNRRWFPYVKGSGCDRFYAPVEFVIDFADGGREIKEAVRKNYPYLRGKTNWVVKNEDYYFRPGLTFSLVNSRRLALRLLPKGCIFDVAGSALFEPNGEDKYLLAWLNSTPIALVAESLNPTINFQVGDLKRLPLPSLTEAEKESLSELAEEAIRASFTVHSRSFADYFYKDKTSAEGNLSSLWLAHNEAYLSAGKRLASLQSSIDQLVITILKRELGLDRECELEFRLMVDKKKAAFVPKFEPESQRCLNWLVLILERRLSSFSDCTLQLDENLLSKVFAGDDGFIAKVSSEPSGEFFRRSFFALHAALWRNIPRLILFSSDTNTPIIRSSQPGLHSLGGPVRS